MALFFSTSQADTEVEQQIKVSFVYNFAKFVTWPNVTNNPNTPLIICASAPPSFLAKMLLLKNRKINIRPLEVIALSDAQAQNCNLIFFSESVNNLNKKSVLEAIATLPILTISDKPDFAQEGGMIGMKELNNRLRFDINLIAAKKAGLTISSQLAELADEVIK